MSNKKFNPAWLLAIFIPIIFIIAIVAFLSSEECYQQNCITGWQVLKLEWPGFWIFAWGGLGLGLLMWGLAYFNESGTGAIGRKLPGSDGLTIALVLVGLMVMCGPWGKACTDKSNGGITAPGYKPKTEQVDTTLQDHSRIPAKWNQDDTIRFEMATNSLYYYSETEAKKVDKLLHQQ